MDSVRFLVQLREDLGGAAEVVPVVGGTELTDLIHAFEKTSGMETRDSSYGGLIPSYYRLGSMSEHFCTMARKVPLLGCDCGEWGCWPLLASVTQDQETITWDRFEQPFRQRRDYSNFGPFQFGRKQYVAALAAADQELSALAE